MPNKDKTGPNGTGPTGRGRGNCGKQKNNAAFGRCCTNGLGREKGFCALEQGDKAVLEAQINAHQAKLNAMQARLDGLNTQDT